MSESAFPSLKGVLRLSRLVPRYSDGGLALDLNSSSFHNPHTALLPETGLSSVLSGATTSVGGD